LIYQFAFETGHESHEEEEHESHEGHDHEGDEECHHEVEEELSIELQHNVNLGLSWQFDEYNELFKNNLLMRTENIPGAFAEYSLSGLWNLTLVGGFRADFHNLYGTFLTPRFHLRYELTENTIFRASVGKGFHVANIYAENTGLMASSREFVIEEKLNPEEALNYGLNMTSDFYIGDMLFTLNADYYRTDFINQVIIDMDREAGFVYFYNLDGKSYSNSFQVDLTFQPFSGLELVTAYRLNDVQMTYDGNLEQKPMVNKHKAFLNASYTTDDADWIFDFTFNLNGGGRLPNTSANPVEYQLDKTYPAYIMLHGQVEKEFDMFSIYLGVENLLDYKQPNPILAYNDPFGKYFDSSMIWAPIEGRVIYVGMRFKL
jgi:outer membrane receptor for ferrienterochelin and colicin